MSLTVYASWSLTMTSSSSSSIIDWVTGCMISHCTNSITISNTTSTTTTTTSSTVSDCITITICITTIFNNNNIVVKDFLWWLVSWKKCSIKSTSGSNNYHILSFKLLVVLKAKDDNFSVLRPISMTSEPISSELLRYAMQDTRTRVLSNSERLTQLRCFSSLTTSMICFF